MAVVIPIYKKKVLGQCARHMLYWNPHRHGRERCGNARALLHRFLRDFDRRPPIVVPKAGSDRIGPARSISHGVLLSRPARSAHRPRMPAMHYDCPALALTCTRTCVPARPHATPTPTSTSTCTSTAGLVAHRLVLFLLRHRPCLDSCGLTMLLRAFIDGVLLSLSSFWRFQVYWEMASSASSLNGTFAQCTHARTQCMQCTAQRGAAQHTCTHARSHGCMHTCTANITLVISTEF